MKRLPRPTLEAIARAVEAQHGDMDDVRDLAATWERIHLDRDGKAARLAYDAANPVCHCALPDLDTGDERCARCHGQPRQTNTENAR